ncbi:MAG: M3 family oligoendopeptidase [Anaerolineaceae bacterium]|nr:M3 family oligoendopeptidase [Anaerolineaceae bacterium]MCB9099320.1 M3 family oligoendopeptidase [Anaerolineales bacterium]
MSINVNWDLDSIFEGGSQSSALADFLARLTTDLDTLAAADRLAPLTDESQSAWVAAIQTLFDLGARLNQASSFIGCLVSQNVKDEKALQLMGQTEQLGAKLGALWTRFQAAFAEQDDTDWTNLVTQTDLHNVTFYLNKSRELARQKMAPELETLANDLATDGYHAWGRLYDIISGDKEVEFEGKPTSLGQLQSRFYDDPDRSVRQAAFELFEQSWAGLAKTCALALNFQAGFRLALYKHRDWPSVLHEPLLNNRFSAETLEAMWSVVDAKSAKLLDYFNAKAKLFGVDKLAWFDVDAPIGQVTKTFTYQEASDFVVDSINTFDSDIAGYCRMAIDNHWIEAEDRSGKRAGAYCTSLPLSKESRIFMTYNGSYNGMLTLAHELGHGYHSWAMRDLPYGARRYTMSVAETASTFNEMVVRNASYTASRDDQDRLSILGTKLNDAAAFLMNIRARFLFEQAFFEQRAKTQLSVDDLNELMLSAQKTAYKDGLAVYHPLFWASKLHFYLTYAPFYNFPYTFGFLFSNGVYAQAVAEGPAFHDRYVALLRDTGSMDTEDLAQKHLGVDLTQPAFWETAADRVLADVDEFVALAEKVS